MLAVQYNNGMNEVVDSVIT